MTFQQLKYLVELSKKGSISKAAEAMFVTQPCITRALHDLEQEFGICIAERNNKGIIFTDEGNELLFYAKSIVEQSEAIRYHFHPESTSGLAKYTISSQHHSYVIAAVTKLINRLMLNQYEVLIREEKTEEVISDVSAGKSIVGFIAIQDENREMLARLFHEKQVDFFSVFSQVQHVYIRKKHPLADGQMVRKADLLQYPLITYQYDDVPLYISEWNSMNSDPPKKIFVNDRGSMYEIITHTDCYALGTGLMTSEFSHKDIMTLPVENGPQLSLGYLLPAGTSMTEEVKRIIDDYTGVIIESASGRRL